MIPAIRLRSQQLVDPQYDCPGDLVAWMGAIQAQDYTQSKWAIGLRLRTPSLRAVDRAIASGKIVRTHILRPTWHWVSGKDLRWMIKLTGRRVCVPYDSFGRSHGFTPAVYHRYHRLLEKILTGSCLGKTEIARAFERAGYALDDPCLNRVLMYGEAEGIFCGGPDREGKPGYTLLEEHVPPVPELSREEALARLALLYFQSHSPASFEDFVWWSGLAVREAREGFRSISEKLFDVSETHWVYGSMKPYGDKVLHLLPPYDEYLISYKDRSAVLRPEYARHAHNTFGIFQPVILQNGQIVGNWKKPAKAENNLKYTVFIPGLELEKRAVEVAESRWRAFRQH